MRALLLLTIVSAGPAFGYQKAAEQQFPSKEKTAAAPVKSGKHKKTAKHKSATARKNPKTATASKPQ